MKGRKRNFIVLMIKGNITETSEAKIKTLNDMISFIRANDYNYYNFMRKNKIEYKVKKVSDNEIEINGVNMKIDDSKIIIEKNNKVYVIVDGLNKHIDEFISLVQEELQWKW